SLEVKTIELVPASKDMAAVVVTAKKPPVEMKAGKLVVNVDASPSNQGTNALELLEKSPGITVDNDGNISLKGKAGVTILIDGKPTYMSGADLAALLKSMQSSNIDQVEIMTNPSARYDAAGNSGVINIKTKKGTIRGTNGSINIGHQQGVYGRTNASLNLNYRNDKLNVFGAYNAGTYEGFNNLTLNRRLYEPDKTTLNSSIDQVSVPHFKGTYHNVKLGVDYNFSKRDVAGVVFNGNFNNNKENPKSSNNLRDANGNITNMLKSYGDNERNQQNYSVNANYKHTFDSTGRELTVDLDYAYYTRVADNFLSTTGYDRFGIKQGNDVWLRGNIPSDINIYSARLDYVHPFRSGAKLEAGLKSSIVNTDNEVVWERSQGTNIWTPDARTNHFIYKENINAAYVILSKTIKKWD
ncbi:MAG: TonB-dependent receptor, partial [Pedobacter sp.]